MNKDIQLGILLKDFEWKLNTLARTHEEIKSDCFELCLNLYLEMFKDYIDVPAESAYEVLCDFLINNHSD